MDNPGAVNVLSLCAGVGGLELGVELAEPRARTVCLVEREAHAVEVLAARMEQGALSPCPVWSDVATFDGRPWRGVVDLVTSGDPCQPNSVAGKNLGDADDRWLLDHVVRIVEEIRPGRFFRENVTGNLDGQLAYLVPALERMGYRVAAGIFSAGEVGFGHRRERLFIMADRCRVGRWSQGDADDDATRLPAKGRRAMADPTGQRVRGKRGDVSRPKRTARQDAGEGRIGDSAGGRGQGAAMGNADRSADEREAPDAGRQSVERAAIDGPGASTGELPFAAPGPADPRWRVILAAAPHLEPAVRRVDARLADRVDRLRECGNGVSSLAAAWAWVALGNLLDSTS